MENRRIPRNAAVAVAQVVVTSLFLFILYRYLLANLGIARVGVWSVVMATVSTSRLGQLGLSGSVVKYVAKYVALSDNLRVRNTIQTALITIAVMVAALGLVAYPAFGWLFHLVVPIGGLHDALKLLPYALVSLWVNAVAGVIQSGLDGCQRIDLRGYLMMLGNGLFLSVALVLIPGYGLIGLACAQILQGLFLIAFGWYLLRRSMPVLSIFPLYWNKRHFMEMLGYGANFQLISLMQMLYEPTTKLLLTHFGGLSVTGYYEMASRMVTQFRTLLTSGNQVLVPVIAEIQEHKKQKTVEIYRKSYRLMFFLAAPFYAILLAFTSFVSDIWIGHYEPVFVISSILLIGAYWVNTITAPSYFAYLGTGRLRWNSLGHIIMGLLNLILGYWFGILIGSTGPVWAWSIALTVGSMTTAVAYHLENSIPLTEMIPHDIWIILVACITASVGSLMIYQKVLYRTVVIGRMGAVLAVFALFVLPFVWRHPLRGRLMSFFHSQDNADLNL